MFSFLDMVNHSLSYFNINTKLKNRVYTIIALLGDFYLIYVTTRLLINHVWLRGLLYCLAVIAVSYFVYLNAIYYFLGYTSRLDFLSPYLGKIVGVEAEPDKNQQRRNKVINTASNGIYHNEETIPAEIACDPLEQRNLNHVANELLDQGLLVADFNGMSNDDVLDQYAETEKPVDALNAGQQPPYFELVHDRGRRAMEVCIGVNQMDRRAVGHITKVGLTDIHTAHDLYQLYLANVTITGGPNKIPGRQGSTIMMDGDYHLVVQVAYRHRRR